MTKGLLMSLEEELRSLLLKFFMLDATMPPILPDCDWKIMIACHPCGPDNEGSRIALALSILLSPMQG